MSVSFDHTPIPSRCCNTCGKSKPLTTEFFFLHKRSGFYKRCRVCSSEVKKGLRPKKFTHAPPAPTGFKCCTKCKEIKPATAEYFARERDGKFGLQPHCKACMKQINAEWYLRNKDRANARDREWTKANPDKKKAIKARRKERLKQADGYGIPFFKSKQIEIQSGRCFYCRTPISYKFSHIDHMTPISRGGTNHPENKVVCCHQCNSRKHVLTADEYMAVLAEEINFAP